MEAHVCEHAQGCYMIVECLEVERVTQLTWVGVHAFNAVSTPNEKSWQVLNFFP